jgi:hypothetical protein
MVSVVLTGLFMQPSVAYFVLIEGGAQGADACAAKWADDHRIRGAMKLVEHQQYRADWDKYGKAAGVIRNAQMLRDGKPNLVVAFTDDLTTSRGTRNMVEQARKAGVDTWVIGH